MPEPESEAVVSKSSGGGGGALPPGEGAGGLAQESDLERVRRLTMGAAAAWLDRDVVGQNAMLDEILGGGLVWARWAVDLMTDVRFYGIQPGNARAGTVFTTRWRPDRDCDAEVRGLGLRLAGLVRRWWSALATGDRDAASQARLEFCVLSLGDMREALRIMSFDAAYALAEFGQWNRQGLAALAGCSPGGGRRCEGCLRAYRVDLVVPDRVWGEVDGGRSGAVLCGGCIVARMERAAQGRGGFGYLVVVDGALETGSVAAPVLRPVPPAGGVQG